MCPACMVESKIASSIADRRLYIAGSTIENCVICLSATADVLLDCKHVCLCQECATEMISEEEQAQNHNSDEEAFYNNFYPEVHQVHDFEQLYRHLRQSTFFPSKAPAFLHNIFIFLSGLVAAFQVAILYKRIPVIFSALLLLRILYHGSCTIELFANEAGQRSLSIRLFEGDAAIHVVVIIGLAMHLLRIVLYKHVLPRFGMETVAMVMAVLLLNIVAASIILADEELSIYGGAFHMLSGLLSFPLLLARIVGFSNGNGFLEVSFSLVNVALVIVYKIHTTAIAPFLRLLIN